MSTPPSIPTHVEADDVSDKGNMTMTQPSKDDPKQRVAELERQMAQMKRKMEKVEEEKAQMKRKMEDAEEKAQKVEKEKAQLKRKMEGENSQMATKIRRIEMEKEKGQKKLELVRANSNMVAFFLAGNHIVDAQEALELTKEVTEAKEKLKHSMEAILTPSASTSTHELLFKDASDAQP